MNRISLTLALILAVASAHAEMEPATPESQGVSSSAILEWIDACERTFGGEGRNGAIHGFVIVRHGKVIAEGSWKPFDTLNETHMLYSHSKSFTASAVGLLVDEGKLDLDERVVDLFPDCAPTNAAPAMREMRVRDLLTMNVGSDLNHDVAKHRDWCRGFFERRLDRRPGTGFKYDSDATYMLAAIVERKSGKRLMDFLGERLFAPIGIAKAWSNTSPQGIACGGWGMNMTTRDLARFGQLYLQRGRWEGRSVLSSDWVALATTRQTWSSGQRVGTQRLGEGSDWEQGYGFQFWRCTHGCYRADGAFGQFTIVMPEQDAVVSIHAGVADMGRELKLVWDHLLPAMRPEPLPENAAALAALRGKTAALAIAPVAGEPASPAESQLLGDYAFEKNGHGFRSVRLERDGDGWQLEICARCPPVKTPVGCGEWRRGGVRIDPDEFEALGTLRGDQPTAASAAWQPDGSLKCRAYLTGATHYLDLTFQLRDGKPTVEGMLWSMGGTKLKGAR